MITATIQIGNSDNKLSQNDWSHFCHDMHERISEIAHEIHFKGGSDYDAPWQNACWVVIIKESCVEELHEAVYESRSTYSQESAALTLGNTTMI